MRHRRRHYRVLTLSRLIHDSHLDAGVYHRIRQDVAYSMLESPTMNANQPIPAPERPLFMPPAPGYFATKRILKRIHRFQDLIRHRERWAADLEFACPLEDLVPANVPEIQRVQYLDGEILRMMQGVHRAVNFAGVPTGVYYERRNPVDQENEREHYDLILDYQRLPRQDDAYKSFQAVMGVLEQAIGVYDVRLNQAKREIFNPVAWAAHLIRLPITVMERAGLVGHEKTVEMVLGGYAKFMRVAMSVILILIALLLGVKIPWKEIVARLLDLIAK
jgi:hypothetical protein